MIPILYDEFETDFDSNGIGMLVDETDTTVIEGSGKFELEMKYPITGSRFRDIKKRAIIMAKPNPMKDPQPFRIERITKVMGDQVTVYAKHLAYDNIGITCSPFAAETATEALQAIKSNAVGDCPFEFWTDIDAVSPMEVKVPQQIWTLMGSDDGCILNLYGGEYEFDRYRINLWSQRGMDRGVSIRYGKNLRSLEQDENIASCYTAVHPYWANSDGLCVELPEKIVKASGNYGYVRIMPLDLSQVFEIAPTEDELREQAKTYIESNNIGVPATSWKIQFELLEKAEEYKGKALLEQVLYGDTVSVFYEDLDIEVAARVNEVRYKPRLERYDSVSLGDVKQTLADTIISQKKQLSKKPTMSQMQTAISLLTSAILGAKGGSVRLLDTDGDEMPDTLYIADNPDPEKAVKVWRFNYEGWAASKNGYNGPFVMGASFDNGILADFITAGTLYGLLIKAGTIVSEDGRVKINLNSQGDRAAVFNSSIRTNGLSVQSEADNSIPILDVSSSPNEMFWIHINNPEDGEPLCLLTTPLAVNWEDGTVAGVGGIAGYLYNAYKTRCINFSVNEYRAEINMGAPNCATDAYPIRILLEDGVGTIKADQLKAGNCIIDSTCEFVWNTELGMYVLAKPQ